MLLDLTLPVTKQMLEEAKELNNPALEGHLGTHFDAMDKEFPLEYTRRKGIVFDVSSVRDGEIGVGDLDADSISHGMFVAFYTGYGERVGYGNPGYFSAHPTLSVELIDLLLQKGVSIIGVDFAGIRRGKEHTPMDARCASFGTFVVENLVGLQKVLAAGGSFTAHTYPMRFVGVTGLPCRVLAEL